MSDLYALFGVPRDADPATLKQRWRQLARELHPDRNPEDPDAAGRLAELSAAWAVLSDPERRRLYDRYGEDATSAFFHEAATPAPAARAPERGDDHEVELVLDGPTAAAGGAHEVIVRAPRPCERCGGTGWRAAGRACPACEGGTIPGIGPFRVMVPSGVVDGQELVVPGMGASGRGRGAEPGDLRITVRVAAAFAAVDGGVQVEVPCSASLLAAGGHVVVPCPDGRRVRLRLKPGTPMGQRLRVPGRGGEGRDLLVVVSPGPGPVREVKAVKLRASQR